MSHPNLVNVEDARRNGSAPEDGKPGWIDMDVRWLVTRESVGSDQSVFGVTYFPPGSRHEIHRHPGCEEVEYLISGHGVARVGEDDVEMGHHSTSGRCMDAGRHDFPGVCFEPGGCDSTMLR